MTQNQMMEILERFSESKLSEEEQIENIRRQHHLDLASITNILDSSKKAREKIVSFFLCRGKCAECNDRQSHLCAVVNNVFVTYLI